MKIKILKYSLAALTILFGFLAWRSIDRAINVPDASVWGMPTILFSLFFVLSYLDVIVIKKIAILQLIFLAIFVSSFAYIYSFWHIVAVSLSYLFALWALLKIKKDLRLNVKISLWKSIRTGSTLLLFAISMMITSQYYFEVKDLDSAHLIPQFNVGAMTGGLTTKIISAMNPQFKNLDQDGLTVDQFILQTAQGQNQDSGISDNMNDQIDQTIERSNPKLTAAQKNILKEEALKKVSDTNSEISKGQNELILQEGRNKFSEISGTDLTGSEKVSDVLSGLVNRKINQYLGSGLSDSEKSSPLPYIMAIGLFLTVLPLGSLLNTLWMLIVELIIWIFIKSELISIAKIPVEMEVIE